MPEVQVGADGSFADQSAMAEESAKVDAARAELLDEASGQQEGGDGELILGKYKSTEDLAAAYQSLQAEYTRLKGGQPEPAPAEDATPASVEAPEPEQDAPADEPRLTAQDAERIRGQIFEQVGGEERYTAIAGWAAKNLPEGRVAAFNAALEKGDSSVIINQLKGLQYDYMMATGYEPRLTGGRAPSNQVKGFASEAQVIEAMQDPRYSGSNPDPAYIKEVEQRIAVSNVFTPR